jgi:response regulator RpfG family c-di-GMP phosphodiesterase
MLVTPLARFPAPDAFGTRDRSRPPMPQSLDELLTSSIILREDWEALPKWSREEIVAGANTAELYHLLLKHDLLTAYQVARISAHRSFGLVLGNYRVLDRLGAGGMGVVFLAEHVRMRRRVAIKVLPTTHAQDDRVLTRFFTEMRAVAQLNHPNIVAAMDAGEVASSDPDEAVLHYFAMEYVPGHDLEEIVSADGPMSPAMACDLAYQVASALDEAHRHQLVHRDIKPSNVKVTPEDQAKLLDFGLTRHFRHRVTEPGVIVGTIEYMAPEQAGDASSVDIRADVYGLGATLFWCLTGKPPFLCQGNLVEDLTRRLTEAPPSVRAYRPDLPADLDAVVSRMMAINPDGRYATPQAAMRALLPFIRSREDEYVLRHSGPAVAPAAPSSGPSAGVPSRVRQVLLVDDEAEVRQLCKFALQSESCNCRVAGDGQAALEAIRSAPPDLVLLDIDMPVMRGIEVLRQLRETPPAPHLKVIMVSGGSSADEMSQMLLAGADDYMTKPFSLIQLQARVESALRLKGVQDRSDLLTRHLLKVNSELEQNLTARDSDLVDARNALVLALAKLVEHRHTETGTHLMRLQRYVRCLAEEAMLVPGFAGEIDEHFVQMVECCAPLHDIGKVGLPDHILLKPGKLEADERILMQTHTIIGTETLQEVAKQHGNSLVFLQMAIDIARHHHERWDGTGYPDRLAGTAIPLSARLVAVADVYDALRSRRVYKPALSHGSALHIMVEGSPGHFDPALMPILTRCAKRFDLIYRELTD